MGLLFGEGGIISDLFTGRRTIGEVLTGRSRHEHDVYANPELVEQVTAEIRKVATTGVDNAEQAVFDALRALNNTAQNVGAVEISKFEPVFDSLSQTISDVADKMDQKVADIKEYEEAPLLKKVASTVFMGVCKVGEGLASVVEDIGDGVVSLVGWTAGKLGAKGVQDWAGEFVKKEWSHDMFNFYYKSDLAKASACTEESAIAGACKLGGKAVGYYFLGAAAGAAIGGVAAKGAGVASKIATAATHVASTSTLGATAVGIVGGIGSGTQSGLQSGMDFDDAFKVGLKSGAIQGTMAFVGGKIGEKVAKTNAIKSAEANLDAAQKAVDSLADKADDFLEGSFTKTAESSAKAFEAHANLDAAKEALNVAKNAKLSSFQGYDNAITKAGEKFGKAITHQEGMTLKGFITESAEGIKAGVKAIPSKVAAVPGNVASKVRDTASSLKPTNVVQSIGAKGRSIASSAKNAFVHPLKTAGNIVKGTGKIVGKTVATTAKVVSKAAVPVGVIVNESLKQEAKEYSDILTKTEAAERLSADVEEKMVNNVQMAVGDAPVASSSTFTGGKIDDDLGGIDDREVDQIEPTSYYDPTGGSNTYSDEVLTGNGDTGNEYTSTGTKTGTSHGGSTGTSTGGGSTGGGYTPAPREYTPIDTPGTTYTPEIPEMSTTPISPSTSYTPQTVPLTSPSTIPYASTTPISTNPISVDVPTVDLPTYSTVPSTSQSGYIPPAATTPVQPRTNPVSLGGGYTPYTQTPASVSSSPVSAGAAATTHTSGIAKDIKDSSLTSSLSEAASVESTIKAVDDIVSGNKIGIPTSIKPGTATKVRKMSSAIPITAGLATASIAGIGAKAYMDHKNSDSTDDEDYDDDGSFDDWNDEENSQAQDKEFVPQNPNEGEYYTASDVTYSMGLNDLEEA